MGAAQSGAARARARKLSPMAADGSRGPRARAAELPDLPQSAARRTQARARRAAQVASAAAGATRRIAAGLRALPRPATRSARARDEALPAVRAVAAGAARQDARELASLAADDAGAAPRSTAPTGTMAPTPASRPRTRAVANLVL